MCTSLCDSAEDKRVGAYGLIGEWRPGSSSGGIKEVVFRVVYWYTYLLITCCVTVTAPRCGPVMVSFPVGRPKSQVSPLVPAELFTGSKTQQLTRSNHPEQVSGQVRQTDCS